MVDGYKFQNFFNFFFAHNSRLLDEYVGLISVTVQNPEIQNTNFMNFFYIKLVWTHIPHYIVALHKLL